MNKNDMKKGAKEVAKNVKKVVWDNKIGKCVTIAAGLAGAGYLAYKFIPAVNKAVNETVAKAKGNHDEPDPAENKEEK